MNRARILDPISSLIVGTIGNPGEREFYLQTKFENGIFSFAIDKGQVAALVERLDLLIEEFKKANYRLENVDSTPFELPLVSEFNVGLIGIMWLEDRKQITLDIQALSDEDNDLVPEDEEGPELFRIFMSPELVYSFVRQARKIISAGRPPCPFCALPINREGHLCPRANGYRR